MKVEPHIYRSVQRALWRMETRRKQVEGGYVYFFECGDFVKIGHTLCVKSRLKSIQTSNPHPVKLIGSFESGVAEEQIVHEHLSKYHHRGEWYRKCEELMEIIALTLAEDEPGG